MLTFARLGQGCPKTAFDADYQVAETIRKLILLPGLGVGGWGTLSEIAEVSQIKCYCTVVYMGQISSDCNQCQQPEQISFF